VKIKRKTKSSRILPPSRLKNLELKIIPLQVKPLLENSGDLKFLRRLAELL
jgi:hypothetical protein